MRPFTYFRRYEGVRYLHWFKYPLSRSYRRDDCLPVANFWVYSKLFYSLSLLSNYLFIWSKFIKELLQHVKIANINFVWTVCSQNLVTKVFACWQFVKFEICWAYLYFGSLLKMLLPFVRVFFEHFNLLCYCYYISWQEVNKQLTGSTSADRKCISWLLAILGISLGA